MRVLFHELLAGGKNGLFWELDAGDGAVGSHSLALELFHGWTGWLQEERRIPLERLKKHRTAQVHAGPLSDWLPAGSPDLAAAHKVESAAWLCEQVRMGRIAPRVLVFQHPQPDTRFVRALGGRYRLAFYFHDDEYFVKKP